MFNKGNAIRSANDNLVAPESKLGWILSGTHKTGERISNTHIYHVDSYSQEPEPINSTLKKFKKQNLPKFWTLKMIALKHLKKI